MRFDSREPEGADLGLIEAALRGLAPSGCAYVPRGEADLRPALYSPFPSFPDLAAAVTLALFAEELDPLVAGRLSWPAFESPPPSFAYGDGIIVIDLASGPSGSSADYGAAFLASVVASSEATTKCGRLVLAEGGGREGAALAEAFAVGGRNEPRREGAAKGRDGGFLALLRPRHATIRGIEPQRLARNGGFVVVLDVDCEADALRTLLARAAGRTLAGLPVTIGGPANPARFAARAILHAAAFSVASRGFSGDVLGAIAPGDGTELAAALWAWRFGLPQSGLVDTRNSEKVADRGSGPGRELLERFDEDNPGAARSLVRDFAPTEAQAESARMALAAAGGPLLDRASASSLAAAGLALDAGLRGHARIVVYREVLPDRAGPDSPSALASGNAFAGALSDPPADASIRPSIEALEAALRRLARDLGLERR